MNTRSLRIALGGLALNVAFAVYYIIFGALSRSWWLLTLGAYYAVLSLLRFVVLRVKRGERFVTKATGAMLTLMTLPLVGTVLLSLIEDRGTRHGTIIMIAIAAYAFAKISIATVSLIRSRKSNSARVVTLRNISFADACVSIFSLQRSMLVSFGDMPKETVRAMNGATGAVVCVTVLLFGIYLLTRKSIESTKKDGES